jgi:hypothetical protein
MSYWIIESGATCHICCNRTFIDKLKDLEVPQAVTLGDGRSIEATRHGTVSLNMKQSKGKYTYAILHNVLYVPELSYDLLSTGRVTERGKTVTFDEQNCR